MLGLLPWLALSFGPPTLPEPVVVAPAAGTEAAPSAAALAPDANDPTSDPVEPVPTAPESAAPPQEPPQPAASQPEVAPPETPQPEATAAPLMPVGPAPAVATEIADPVPSGHIRVQRPRFNGTWMLVGAGLSFGTAGLIQAVDSLFLGDIGSGVAERVFLSASIGLTAGGAMRKAHADAYDDTAFRRERPQTRKALIAGAVLIGVGVALGTANEGMWWNCVFNETGPYAIENDPDGFQTHNCRSGLTRGLLDVSAASTVAGVGLLTWALVYRRDAKAYARARVIGLNPTFGRGRAGLSLQGRF